MSTVTVAPSANHSSKGAGLSGVCRVTDDVSAAFAPEGEFFSPFVSVCSFMEKKNKTLKKTDDCLRERKIFEEILKIKEKIFN